ncbi:hypothetical protein JOB18_047104 [Solea senegalensis]|uniref:Uncharacterized protein n=1 Tax=Solea senegalensis TaxID=28829 RepID=A0AAV6T223_SOLSE|nr:hypothetical protein JOB18_047104 [Solea senegalensis]
MMLSSSPKTLTDRRLHCEGQEQDTVRGRKEKVSFDLCCETSVCSSSGLKSASRELWVWQHWLSLFCLSGNVFFLLEGRHPDRQTDKPQATQSSGVEIAVTSRRKSLHTEMHHCSDTTKWLISEHNTRREKSAGLTRGQEPDES